MLVVAAGERAAARELLEPPPRGGPSGVRIAAAVLFGLGGLAVVAGRIGGRRLPLVAADLLRYALGARRYAGPPAELVRSKPRRMASSEISVANSAPERPAASPR